MASYLDDFFFLSYILQSLKAVGILNPLGDIFKAKACIVFPGGEGETDRRRGRKVGEGKKYQVLIHDA